MLNMEAGCLGNFSLLTDSELRSLDSDWVLDCDKPDDTISRREIREWVEQVYEHPNIASVKRLLVNALDIVISRNNACEVRSQQHSKRMSPVTPSRDLTDIQIMARMQENSLRESTLQRNKSKKSPVQDYNKPPDEISSRSKADFRVDWETKINDREAADENFRSRNYADQGTFRVKRKNSDNLKRPVIEGGKIGHGRLTENDEFEKDERAMMNTGQNQKNYSLSEVMGNNSRMILEAKQGERQITRPDTIQQPIIRSRNANNAVQSRPSVNAHQNSNSTLNAVNKSMTSATTALTEPDRKVRNKSIPRARTGIPVMSTSSSNSAITHGAVTGNGSSSLRVATNGSTSARSVSPRRRNSSGTVVPSTVLKRYTNSGTSTQSTSKSSSQLNKSHLPTTRSSSSLKHARSSGRLDDASVAKSQYALDDEFY